MSPSYPASSSKLKLLGFGLNDNLSVLDFLAGGAGYKENCKHAM